jgi:hypothetical protein
MVSLSRMPRRRIIFADALAETAFPAGAVKTGLPSATKSVAEQYESWRAPL